MKKNQKSYLLLLATAAIWGMSIVAQSAGLEYIRPFTFNAIRFAIGMLVLLPFAIAKKATLDKRFFLSTSLMGFILFASSAFQQHGLLTASAGKAGFITSLYIVLVPIISQIFGRKLTLQHWLAVATALAGLYLMTYSASGLLSPADLALLAGSLGFSFHIIAIGRFGQQADAFALSASQFGVASILSAIASFLFEPSPQISHIQSALPALLYVGIFSCGVAYTFQVMGQRDSHPTIASLILGLEAVFALIGGMILLKERLSFNEILGSLLMLAAVFYVSILENRAIETSPGE